MKSIHNWENFHVQTKSFTFSLNFFLALFSEPLDQSAPNKHSTFETRCTCGKNSYDPYKLKCTSSKCPCNRISRACSRKCRCRNCNNDNNHTTVESKGLKGRKGCTCGNTLKYKETSHVSCRDGKRKTKCPCVAGGFGCSEICRCYNCGNVIQTGGVSITPNQQRKRKRETISTYKRTKGVQFMRNESAPVTSGPWSVLETLCLVVCKEVLLINGLPTNSSNFTLLYNLVAESNEVKELSLTVAVKSTAQVAAKMAHLRDNCAYKL